MGDGTGGRIEHARRQRCSFETNDLAKFADPEQSQMELVSAFITMHTSSNQ